MPNWSETSTVYKVGTFGVFFSFLFFLFGFTTPAWLETSSELIGFWQTCSASMEFCSPNQFGVSAGIDAIRAVDILAFLFLVFGVIMAIVVNTCSPQMSPSIVSGTTITGGILGCIIDVVCGVIGIIVESIHGTDTVHLSWSFALNIIGSVLAIIFGIIVAVSTNSHVRLGHVIQTATVHYNVPQTQVYFTNVQQTTTAANVSYPTVVTQTTYNQATAPPIGEHIEQTGNMTAPQPSNYVQPPAYQQHGV